MDNNKTIRDPLLIRDWQNGCKGRHIISLLLAFAIFACLFLYKSQSLDGNLKMATRDTIYGGDGTIYLHGGEFITAADVTSVWTGNAKYTLCTRYMYDRRTAAWGNFDSYCMITQYSDEATKQMEIIVNSADFTIAEAIALADYYGEKVGRLPKGLRRDVDMLQIHAGADLWGGGGRMILIHTGFTEILQRWNNVHETLFHEAAHTSLDSYLYGTTEWNNAQEDDGVFISDYARNNPQRDDVAESSVIWFALRQKPELFSPEELTALDQQANRFRVFDEMRLEMSPWPELVY